MPELTKRGINSTILWEVSREIDVWRREDGDTKELKHNLLALVTSLIEDE